MKEMELYQRVLYCFADAAGLPWAEMDGADGNANDAAGKAAQDAEARCEAVAARRHLQLVYPVKKQS